MVDRLGRLRHLVADRKRAFNEAYEQCNTVSDKARLDKECVAFLTSFKDTTEKHAAMWLRPPLVFSALGDPAQGQAAALAIADAMDGRQQSSPTPLTRGITTPEVTNSRLMASPKVRADVRSLALGQPLSDLPDLLQWVRQNVYSLAHQNQAVEGLFNVMDDLAAVGGPRLHKSSLDARMKAYVNEVMATRPAQDRDATGRKKQYHFTKEVVSQIASNTMECATKYTDDLMGRALADPRPAPDYVAAATAAAAHSDPSRRAQYDAVAEAAKLAVPKRGKCHNV